MNDTGPAGANDLIGWLGNARAQLPKRDQGYRAGDVDAFLEQIVKALRRVGVRSTDPDEGQKSTRITTRRSGGWLTSVKPASAKTLVVPTCSSSMITSFVTIG